MLCVADREGGRVECIRAGLQRPLHANRDDTGRRVVNYNQRIIGRPYAIASKGIQDILFSYGLNFAAYFNGLKKCGKIQIAKNLIKKNDL